MRIARHVDVDNLEALEVLVVRFGIECDRTDADEPGIWPDTRFLQADAVVVPIIDIRIHRRPIIGQLKPENNVGFSDQGLTARVLK